uniref:Uncharacterized protein n=1 Tax=Cacopsylla melanoneura TaxID=428564 RepID=A0A8D8WW61_9HEMI
MFLCSIVRVSSVWLVSKRGFGSLFSSLLSSICLDSSLSSSNSEVLIIATTVFVTLISGLTICIWWKVVINADGNSLLISFELFRSDSSLLISMSFSSRESLSSSMLTIAISCFSFPVGISSMSDSILLSEPKLILPSSFFKFSISVLFLDEFFFFDFLTLVSFFPFLIFFVFFVLFSVSSSDKLFVKLSSFSSVLSASLLV